MLNVVGQTRLHDAFWLTQLARHASELSATRTFAKLIANAGALQTVDNKTTAVNIDFIAASPLTVIIVDFDRTIQTGLLDLFRGK